MEHQVHGAEASRGVHQLPGAQSSGVEELLRIPVELVVFRHIVVGCQEEAAGAAGGIADGIIRPGRHHVNHRFDQRPGGEILPSAALGVLGVLLQEPLVGVPLHVGAHDRPVLPVEKIYDQATQFRRVLELVLGPAEDEAQKSLLLAELFQDMAVVVEEFIAVLLKQARPVVAGRNRALLIIRGFRMLVSHLEEEDEGELLHVVAVAHPVVAEDV
jgi:hypothetical protein